MLRLTWTSLALALLALCASGCGDDTGGVSGLDSGPTPSDAGPPDGGLPSLECEPTTVRSACGHEASIVRARLRLPAAAAPVEGSIVVGLYHRALGNGASGGVPHWTVLAAGTVSANDPTEIHFDHCSGGEMWSEENCGYQLWAFVDVDDDRNLDPGEPAGRVFTELSCHADEPLCENIVLDCLDGAGCLAFTDPAYCTCTDASCDGAGSDTRIIACTTD